MANIIKRFGIFGKSREITPENLPFDEMCSIMGEYFTEIKDSHEVEIQFYKEKDVHVLCEISIVENRFSVSERSEIIEIIRNCVNRMSNDGVYMTYCGEYSEYRGSLYTNEVGQHSFFVLADTKSIRSLSDKYLSGLVKKKAGRGFSNGVFFYCGKMGEVIIRHDELIGVLYVSFFDEMSNHMMKSIDGYGRKNPTSRIINAMVEYGLGLKNIVSVKGLR